MLAMGFRTLRALLISLGVMFSGSQLSAPFRTKAWMRSRISRGSFASGEASKSIKTGTDGGRRIWKLKHVVRKSNRLDEQQRCEPYVEMDSTCNSM